MPLIIQNGGETLHISRICQLVEINDWPVLD